MMRRAFASSPLARDCQVGAIIVIGIMLVMLTIVGTYNEREAGRGVTIALGELVAP
jgi:hypothetical protein